MRIWKKKPRHYDILHFNFDFNSEFNFNFNFNFNLPVRSVTMVWKFNSD